MKLEDEIEIWNGDGVKSKTKEEERKVVLCICHIAGSGLVFWCAFI